MTTQFKQHTKIKTAQFFNISINTIQGFSFQVISQRCVFYISFIKMPFRLSKQVQNKYHYEKCFFFVFNFIFFYLELLIPFFTAFSCYNHQEKDLVKQESNCHLIIHISVNIAHFPEIKNPTYFSYVNKFTQTTLNRSFTIHTLLHSRRTSYCTDRLLLWK